ncbi:MAG: aldehyde dehydrogenase family protein [Pseudomonadales bacterium]
MLELTAETSVLGTHWTLLLADDLDPEGSMKVIAPYEGELIATVDTCGVAHVDRALQTAYRMYCDRDRWLPPYERTGVLERAARIMTKEHAHLAMLVSREAGKPLTDSHVEVARAIDTIRLAVNEIRTHAGEVIPMGVADPAQDRVAFTTHEPIGVVVAVSAFNHPLNLVVHQVASAVAAGCPVIVKPAPDTPLSCLRFVQMLHQAGLPRSWAQVVTTAAIPVAEKLVTDDRVGMLSFIGSSKIGWMLRSKLSPGTRCALEHGGCAPVILAKDADRELALEAVLKGGFYHAGQVCVSVQRVYVPRGHVQEFAATLARRAGELRLGDPTDSRTQVGPLIRPEEVDRVHSWVMEAVAEGATCLSGGRQRGRSGYECTVLLNPPSTAKVSRLEVFGPVVCVYGYDVLDDAIDEANSVPFAFQGAVFTRDLDLAMHVYRRLDASAVVHNDHSAFRTDGMPFAGLHQSGLGVGGIPFSIREMQVQKMLVMNPGKL